MAISAARKIAFDVLRRVASEHAYAADLLYAELGPGIKKTDASLATELTLGVLRWQRLLDFLLQRYLDRRLHQGQVLEVQEAQPLTKSLCLVLALYAQTKLCMQRPESGFETAQRFVGIE